jgi:hypothetical protein
MSRGGLRRPLLTMVLAVVGASLSIVLVVGLAGVTQNRHDTDRHDGTSRILLHIETKRDFDAELAAHGLWAACQPTVLQNRLTELAPQPHDRMVLAVEPALGEHARRRLVGCLEDATVDLVRANVEAVTDV